MTHLWHDIKPGQRIPTKINVIVEIPKGSKCKYELEKKLGIIKVDRILATSVSYPANYGFIPQTLAQDGDPLDALVLSQTSIYPGTLVEVRPIGMMKMMDGGKIDNKIICVPTKDPKYSQLKNEKQLFKSKREEIEEFFRVYKALERKKVIVKGITTKTQAEKIIKQAVERYKKEFKK